MSIITIEHFKQANNLYIPIATDFPVANTSATPPNVSDAITNLIAKVEKNVLLNALGLSAYNELISVLPDIDEPENEKWKKLVEGDEYDGKVWNGLQWEYSLLAYAVKMEFMFLNAQNLQGVGVVEAQPQNGLLMSPQFEIANLSVKFVELYQGDFMYHPIVYDDFIDWAGTRQSETEPSLYGYLYDKRADFENIDLNKFQIYKAFNSFGL